MQTSIPFPRRRFLAATLMALACAVTPARAESGPITVFAAASMKTALDAVDALFTAETGRPVVVSYASSAALAKQMEQGAPADVFVSADVPWMDHVAKKDLIDPATRFDLLGNRLVLIAPSDAPETIDLSSTSALAEKIGEGRLATGDVASVPVGKYAKAALEKLGLWESVGPKIAGVDNVRGALALVARGEAKYGIVYATDAKSEPKVTVVGVFPAASHPPIVYPVAAIKGGPAGDVGAYLAFLRSGRAAEIFVGQGFTVLKP